MEYLHPSRLPIETRDFKHYFSVDSEPETQAHIHIGILKTLPGILVLNDSKHCIEFTVHKAIQAIRFFSIHCSFISKANH
jgi:hypothetical protein